MIKGIISIQTPFMKKKLRECWNKDLYPDPILIRVGHDSIEGSIDERSSNEEFNIAVTEIVTPSKLTFNVTAHNR